MAASTVTQCLVLPHFRANDVGDGGADMCDCGVPFNTCCLSQCALIFDGVNGG